MLARTIDVRSRFHHQLQALEIAAHTDNHRLAILIALQVWIGTMFQQIACHFRIEVQQRTDSMLLLAVWIGAALDQSFDRFQVAGTRGFNELIISGQIGHG